MRRSVGRPLLLLLLLLLLLVIAWNFEWLTRGMMNTYRIRCVTAGMGRGKLNPYEPVLVVSYSLPTPLFEEKHDVCSDEPMMCEVVLCCACSEELLLMRC